MWDRATRTYKISVYPSPFSQIFANPDFTPGLTLATFTEWINGGYQSVSQIFKGTNVKTFEECTLEFHLSETEKFH